MHLWPLKSQIKKFLLETSGSTAVEFAIIALPLFLLLVGTIETARIFWTYTVVNEVAQIGARCVGLPQPSCSNNGTLASKAVLIQHIESVAQNRGTLIQTSDVEITLNSTDCATNDQYVHVIISKALTTIIGEIELRGEACHILQPLPTN